MLLSRFSRVVSAIVSVIIFSLFTLPSHAEPMLCSATIDGDPLVNQDNIEVTWYINVSLCKRSKGEFEYVIRVEDNDEKVRDLLRVGSWSLRSTNETFIQVEKLAGVSSKNFKEIFGANVTSCTCEGSDE